MGFLKNTLKLSLNIEINKEDIKIVAKEMHTQSINDYKLSNSRTTNMNVKDSINYKKTSQFIKKEFETTRITSEISSQKIGKAFSKASKEYKKRYEIG